MKRFLRLILVAATMASPLPTMAEELVALPTRDGVTQALLLTTPGTGQPAAVALLFPGSYGNIRLRIDRGQIRFGEGNFLVRSRQLFVDAGIATAVLDAPSDQTQGMDDWFRLGEKHASDIAAVVADIKKRFPDAPVFLVGTSRGTISAAAAGRALGEAVAGVVLTSTLFIGGGRPGPGLSGFDYASIRARVLFVHHVEDGCRFTPYRNARDLGAKYPLISVRGGDPARSDPCEAFSAHGYLGKEAPTVEAIANWMLKKPYRNEVD
jgi:pimeloyl-ACP methyl ester carboxylesterase